MIKRLTLALLLWPAAAFAAPNVDIGMAPGIRIPYHSIKLIHLSSEITLAALPQCATCFINNSAAAQNVAQFNVTSGAVRGIFTAGAIQSTGTLRLSLWANVGLALTVGSSVTINGSSGGDFPEALRTNTVPGVENIALSLALNSTGYAHVAYLRAGELKLYHGAVPTTLNGSPGEAIVFGGSSGGTIALLPEGINAGNLPPFLVVTSTTTAIGGSAGIGISTSNANVSGSYLAAIFAYDIISASEGRLSLSFGEAGNFAYAASTGGDHIFGDSTHAIHQSIMGVTAAVGTCGTSPTINGNDSLGSITIGGGGPTACTLTFARTWGSTTPVCMFTPLGGTAPTVTITAESATAMTVTFSGTPTGLNYRCEAKG